MFYKCFDIKTKLNKRNNHNLFKWSAIKNYFINHNYQNLKIKNYKKIMINLKSKIII